MQTLIHRNRVTLVHISFWCVYLSFFIYQISMFRHGREFELGRALSFGVVQLFFTMLIAYTNYFYLLPRFLVHKNIGKYFIEFAIPFVIIIFIRVHLQRFLMDGYTYQKHYFYSSAYV